MTTMIVLRSSDAVEFKTTIKAVCLSLTLKDMIEALDLANEVPEIPLERVSSNTLKKIVEWLEHNQDLKQPAYEEIPNKVNESIDKWDENFLAMEILQLYDLINAADYLNIPGLLWLTTRAVAYMIKGKNPEEIRQTFNMQNEWSPEELERVQMENKWCEENK